MCYLRILALFALPSLFACATGHSGTATEAQAEPGVQLESEVSAEQKASPKRGELVMDMNENGVEDMMDISDGTSLDEDLNGIPDEVDGVPARGM